MKPQRWRKLGHLFSAEGQFPWMVSHAAIPTAQVIDDRTVRIFFGTRDTRNRTHIAAAIFSLTPEPRLLDLTAQPLVVPGERGAFDDSGASMGCLATSPGEMRLYYVGWNLGVTAPWRNSIGLAVSRDAGVTFFKYSPAPVLDRDRIDPYSLSYPWVLSEGAGWRMWYGSTTQWGATGIEIEHVIGAATSTDGFAWTREAKRAVSFHGAGEFAVARPSVVRDADAYRMWFCARGERYTLGYAESVDGRVWTRHDDSVGLQIGTGAWDSEAICYPCVFDCGGIRYMLYNGNGYGRTGFGLAEMV